MESAHRWSLPDMDQALEQCHEWNRQGISCILHILGEYATSKARILTVAAQYYELIEKMHDLRLDASVSVKPTTLGAIVDRPLCMKIFCELASFAAEFGTGFEIDMEGRGLVEASVTAAARCAAEGYSVTLALQAYLDRTERDLFSLQSRGITPRIVKGAYIGDYNNFSEIQERFKTLITAAEKRGLPFNVGTHDPELIDWICGQMADKKDLISLGFLMGLSDSTKIRLAEGGWTVTEYIPFGEEGEAYQARREKYLSDLVGIGREPAP